MTLDPRAIAELEQRLADLSEWTTGGATPIGTSSMWPAVFCGLDREPVAYCQTDQLAQIITTMRNLLPDLLRERRELRARCLEARAEDCDREDEEWRYLLAEDEVADKFARKARLLRHYANAIRAGRIK